MPPWNAYTLADIEAGTLTPIYLAQIKMRQATDQMRQAVERLRIVWYNGSWNEAFEEGATGREPPDAA